jgi:poly(3-hydroxybutyrate) depolymerase
MMGPMMLRAALLGLVLLTVRGGAQSLPAGTIVDEVRCAGDPAQSYALYLPSGYSPDRRWSVLFAFHPGGRGRAMVEKYRAAAEQYGYIVAASNNSRNGPWSVSAAAVTAVTADVGQRFAVDPRRVYATGMSGGARVAMQLALANDAVAGVIASSAGFPDSEPRASVKFAVFATAGNDDFNYIEMRLLDRRLKTPHRLVVFDGGHTLPPDAVATEAIEWMELQAMKTGRRDRDDALVDRLLEKRRAAVAAATGPADTVHALEGAVADFTGLRDMSAESARLKDLSQQNDVKKALAAERKADDAEMQWLADIFGLEGALADRDRHAETMLALRARVSSLVKKAGGDSAEARQAHRVLRSITAGAAGRVQDREYLQMLNELAVTSPGTPRAAGDGRMPRAR